MIAELDAGISSILSIVPLPGKVTILPVTFLGPVPIPKGLPFIAMFNPETFEVKKGVDYSDEQPIGSQGSPMRYFRTPEPTFHLEFLLDGTGASGEKKEVEIQVQSFVSTVGFSGEEHKPNDLILVWGAFYAQCVLRSMETKYTLFRPNGTPLRATIRAVFKGKTQRLLDLLASNLMSPDLTSFRTVKEGDTLPVLCQKEYKSPRFYIEVAKANGLTSPRRLQRGSQLRFPPIEK